MLGLLLAAIAPQALAAEQHVKDQRIRLLPGELPAAGYFTATNTGSRLLVLVGAENPAVETVMMHKSTQKDGTASMAHIEELRLAPGESVEFSPGGVSLDADETPAVSVSGKPNTHDASFLRWPAAADGFQGCAGLGTLMHA